MFSVRTVGRIVSPFWITYGNLLFLVESKCVLEHTYKNLYGAP